MVYRQRDLRRIVKDTRKYPNNAIAFMDIEFLNDLKPYMGTGFLADKFMFITCAHNVMKAEKSKKKRVEPGALSTKKTPAGRIEITFGLNGQTELENSKTLSLFGSDFTVPEEYSRETDEFDIAWINLKQYYEKETESGVPLDWTLDDLPTQYFRTCSVPVKHGLLSDSFIISGKI